LLSKGEVNKEEVLKLAMCGIEINEPKDIIKDPYVFEFLGVPVELLFRLQSGF
jgi:predicted nuclease of restriction endonuclease-like (RecB) superfamily